MKKLFIIVLIVGFIQACSNGDKPKRSHELSQNEYVSKSDSILNLLEKGEILPEKIIPTRINSGMSFNEFLEPVNVNGILIGLTTRDDLLEIMGSPDSISKEPNYVGDDGGFEERFWYGNSNFTTFDGKVQMVDLADPDFVVNGFLRVGMQEQLIQELFPVSFKLGRRAEEIWRLKGKGYDKAYSVFTGDDLLSIVTKDGKIARMVYIYSV